MTKDEINALPPRVRRYIMELETRCDPAGDIAALAFCKDQCKQLEASNARLRAAIRNVPHLLSGIEIKEWVEETLGHE